jgi:hypothetical protein
MRLPVLALFTVLPAAAYGAVCPQQSSLEFKGTCAQFGESCADRGCCDSLKCTYVSLLGMVCLIVPFYSDSRWVTLSLYVEMHTCVTRRTRSERESAIRGWFFMSQMCRVFRRRARCTHHPPDKWSWCRMFALSPLYQ